MSTQRACNTEQSEKKPIADAILASLQILLTAIEAAAYLRLSLRGFDDGPAKELPVYRRGRNGRRLYRRTDLDAYLESIRCNPEDESARIKGIVDDIVKRFHGKDGAK